jgi:DNA replication and repair protein RecF
VIKQKNRLLKSGEVNNLVLESWSFNQAKLGAVLYLHRRQLLKKVAAETKKIVNKIAPGEDFQVYYLPSWEKEKAETEIKCFLVEESKDETREEIQEKLFEKLLQVSKEECACGYSLLGPHRDEIIINVNNKNSRKFSSQGQQRTIALALKRAAMLIIRETSGRQPIFLLDDAMSELDERRRELLMATINEAQQTFITTTTLNYFTSETIKKAQIIKLPAGAAIK